MDVEKELENAIKSLNGWFETYNENKYRDVKKTKQALNAIIEWSIVISKKSQDILNQ